MEAGTNEKSMLLFSLILDDSILSSSISSGSLCALAFFHSLDSLYIYFSPTLCSVSMTFFSPQPPYLHITSFSPFSVLSFLHQGLQHETKGDLTWIAPRVESRSWGPVKRSAWAPCLEDPLLRYQRASFKHSDAAGELTRRPNQNKTVRKGDASARLRIGIGGMSYTIT